jgi:zinc transport system substrate-binding protein
MVVMRIWVAAMLLLPLLSACGASAESSSGKPTVVASVYPLQYVARRVVGDHATVQDLTQPGVEPHDLELTVQQTAQIVDADVVLYERGLQPAVDEAIDQNGPKRVLDARTVAHLEHGNPHFWLDPERLSAVAAAFAREMSRADPSHARAYARNLAALQQDLGRLDQRLRAGLADCRTTTTVVSHDAFVYLSRYGPRFVPINGLSPEAEPSPEHIRALQDLIRARGITTVFTEPLTSPEMADTLARDLGVRTAVLDPIEGLNSTTRGADYLSLMRRDLAALRKANECR